MKISRLVQITASIFFYFSAISPSASAQIALQVENPGFEQAMYNGRPPGWILSQHAGEEAYAMELDRESPAEGRQSLRIRRFAEQPFGVIFQTLTMDPAYHGQHLIFSAQIKTRDVSPDGWRLTLAFRDIAGSHLSYLESPPIIGTTNWQTIQLNDSIPPGTHTIQIGALIVDQSYGSGWIDDTRVSIALADATIVEAVEYVHTEFGHYFITASAEEISQLDSGKFSGWHRTGERFLVRKPTSEAATPVCRFVNQRFTPKTTHFFTSDDSECSQLRKDSHWIFEGVAFYLKQKTTTDQCISGTRPLYRLYNNGNSGTPNHRYTTNEQKSSEMLRQGWILEGVIGCSP